jgi:hypothetical protein
MACMCLGALRVRPHLSAYRATSSLRRAISMSFNRTTSCACVSGAAVASGAWQANAWMRGATRV